MIGTNLVRQLLVLGHEVHVADNLWRGKMENVADIYPAGEIGKRFHEVDLSDLNQARKVMAGVDVVFHLADIVAGINYVFSHEFEVWQRNTQINASTLAAAIEHGVSKYIYVGTACSYPKHLTVGDAAGKALVEGDVYPADPESSYGWSKLMGEYEIELASKEGLINSTILRLHNVYGFPTEFSHDRSQVIPSLCRKAARYPQEDFVVWGSGRQRRAFLYVEDVVRALVAALDADQNAGPIQIGPSSSTSIAEIAELIVAISGKEIPIVYDTSKPEGDTDRTGDCSKALDLLGWTPQIKLKDGLKLTYDWVSARV